MCFNGTMETKHYPKNPQLDEPAKRLAVPCSRCGGSGIFHTYGTCYRCGGQGSDPTDRDWIYPAAWSDEQCAEHEAKRLDRNRKQAERAAEKRAAKANAAWEANLAACPLLAEVDAEIYAAGQVEDADLPYGSFVHDIRFNATRYPLSDRQIAAFEKAVAKDREHAIERARTLKDREQERASAEEVPTGRVEIEGEVVMRKMYEGEYGVTWKLMLKGDAGWRVFVTEPGKLVTEVGDRVRMVCTIEQSADDPTFGKGKRPTKAEVVTPEPEPECDCAGQYVCDRHARAYQARHGKAINE